MKLRKCKLPSGSFSCDTQRAWPKPSGNARDIFAFSLFLLFDMILASAMSWLNNNKVFNSRRRTHALRHTTAVVVARLELTVLAGIARLTHTHSPSLVAPPHTSTPRLTPRHKFRIQMVKLQDLKWRELMGFWFCLNVSLAVETPNNNNKITKEGRDHSRGRRSPVRSDTHHALTRHLTGSQAGIGECCMTHLRHTP